MAVTWVLLLIGVAGAVGGFVNVFIGDSGLHLPKTENGVWQPGFIGTIVIGTVAALTSWATAKSIVLSALSASIQDFKTGDIANALIVGFGGAKWFKSETEKNILRKTAAIAADKPADHDAAIDIAVGAPSEALRRAFAMH